MINAMKLEFGNKCQEPYTNLAYLTRGLRGLSQYMAQT